MIRLSWATGTCLRGCPFSILGSNKSQLGALGDEIVSIGRPFSRAPREKSSKLYEDRVVNADKLPVEKPGYGAFGSLAAFVVCLIAAGVFCIVSGPEHLLVGIGLIAFGVLPAATIVLQGISLGSQIAEGKVSLAPKVAPEAFGPEADRFWQIQGKDLTRAEFDDASAKREAELAAAREWFELVRPSFEAVDMRASDGCRLVGHELAAAAPSHSWLVYAPGFGGTWKSGLAIARRFAQAGYNLLLLDMRAQGESGGALTGYGHIERRDLVEWCRLVVERDADARIALLGESMGASAAVEAAAERDLPSQVKAVVCDSAYADLWNEAIYMLSRGVNGKSISPHPVLDIARVVFRGRKSGFDIADANAEQAAKGAKVPLLIVHGSDDFMVPSYSARRLAEAAASDHELIKVDGAGHCCASLVNPETYFSAVLGFAQKHLA